MDIKCISSSSSFIPFPLLAVALITGTPSRLLKIFLSISMIDKVVAKLRSGYGRNVPVAVVERATWDNERCIIGTLDDIADKVKEAKITKCAQILVGDFIDCDYDKSLLYDKNFTHMFRGAKE